MKPKVVIIGAGLTGLRAACELARNGAEVTILESEAQVGGMARSHEYNGYVFDHGPHGFYSRKEELRAEFRELVGEGNYHFHKKSSQIYYREKFYNHPLRISDVICNLSFLQAARALCSFLWARLHARFSDAPEVNAEQFFINHFGRVLYEAFFRPFTQKVWAVAPSELDADFARDRVPHLNLWEVLRNLLFHHEPSQATASGRLATHDAHRFYYPKKGAGVLGESLAREIEELGGNIELSVQVTHIDVNAREVCFQTENGPELIAYDQLLSTIPLKSFLNLISPSPPQRILSSVNKLKHRALLLVCLCVKRESVIGPFWIYFTSRIFNRLSEFNKFSADVVPSGKTGLCLEIGCNRGDELYTADDADICRRVVGELEDLDLLKAEDVEDHYVIREPFAYPIYHVDYRQDVQVLMDWISSLGGLHTAGRQGAFLYINQDQALDCGKIVAQHILQSVDDDRQPTKSLVCAATGGKPTVEVGEQR